MPPFEAHRRDLLIALATSTIHRAALCRLGTNLDGWRNLRGVHAAREGARLIGLPTSQVRRALDLRRNAATIAQEEIARAEAVGASIVCIGEAGYPRAFAVLTLQPPAIYVRGDLAALAAAPAIAMVGARTMDAYGKAVAIRFATVLAAAGMTVVSGFAVGVDQAAHRGALAATGGRTVAVLGCGIDLDYPSRSRELAEQIAQRGALVTELPLGAAPRPFHFPMRNRLIAALALGVLVVQAKTRSGSLITAHHALELGREVWAIPGPIDAPLAGGPNGLIADGAALVARPEDILDTLPLAAQQILFPSIKAKRTATSTQRLKGGSAVAEKTVPPGLPSAVLNALPTDGARTVDGLVNATDASVDRVLAALLELELYGHVRRLPGPRYARS